MTPVVYAGGMVWALALLLSLASAAEPGAAEKLCRDRYENGTARQAEAACARCLEAEPGSELCAAAARYLKDRPKLPSPSADAQARTQAQQRYLSGVIYFQKGDEPRAKEEWERCSGLDPKNTDCLAALAYLKGPRKTAAFSEALGKPAAPDGAAGAAEGAGPGQQHYLSGMIFYQKQDYGRAREEWKLCMGVDAYNADCAAGLKRIAALVGAADWDESLGSLDKDSAK